MGKLTKNYIYNIIYQIFVLIVPLATAPYLTRTLGATATGTYSYVHSMTSLICTIALLGIYNYGNRQVAYVRDNREQLTKVFWQIMGTRVVLAIFCTIIYMLIIIIVGKYKLLFFIYYTYILAYCIDCTWLYVGVEDMKWAVIKNTLTKFLAVIGIFLFVKSENDLFIYILIQGGSILISNMLAYSQIKNYVNKGYPIFSNLKKDIWESILLFLPSVAATIYLQCDKIMIELIAGATEQVSFYDYSEKIVTIPMTFITVLSTVMMPRIANEYKKGNKEVMEKLLNEAALYSFFIALPMSVGLISISDKLIPWYLGENFIETSNAIKLISPIIITNTLTGISGSQYFTATNQVSILLKSQVIAAIGNILLNALLIPKYGFYGAAIATLITSILCASIQLFYLVKQVNFHGLLKHIVKYIVFSLIMYSTVKIMTCNMNATPSVTVSQIMIGSTIYILLCYITKDENIEVLKKISKNKLRKH